VPTPGKPLSAVPGPSMAGTADNGLPGVGTFAYSGAPIVTSASHAVVMAAR